MPVAGSPPRFVAVDWGTTRLRASLVEGAGVVLGRVASEAGVQSVGAGGFPAALDAACGVWFRHDPALPVIMAGMVGSRNGWVEAPYMACPCGPEDAAAALMRVPGQDREIAVVPGADVRWPDGCYDVMRGEETQVFGSGIADGLVCLPGTHSKWVAMVGGRMRSFATFVTGELYAALSGSFVGRLATEPEDASGAPEAAVAALRGGGLLRAAFQARSRVLAADMPSGAVRPYLSALLIQAEIEGALALFGDTTQVGLVAAPPQSGLYGAALARRGVRVTIVDPEAATLKGLARIMAARTSA